MPAEANRRSQPGARLLEWSLGAAAVFTLIGGVLVTWLSARIGAALSGDPAPVANPFGYVVQLAIGQARWPSGASLILAVFVVVLLAAAAAVGWVLWRWERARKWVDSRARYLSTARDTAILRRAGAVAYARRLRCTEAGPGSPLGRHGRDGAELYGPWEWVQIWIMGPRAGKTTCVCVPQVMENTSGPVVATTNKRDLVDYTRGPRSELGHCWVFDPQNLIGEPPTWWWNPLSGIRGVEDADELAGLFVAAVRDADVKPDAYFDPEGQALLSGMLLAASCADRPITQVYNWLTDETNAEPAMILEQHGYGLVSNGVYAVSQLTPKQRDGVYGTARAMAGFLRNDKILPWVTPIGPDDRRPQFDPAAFALTRQTIYLVSREGRGTARALTAALTVAIVQAAEDIASHSPSGRLSAPMSVVLDEAANVVRWPDLPDLYSHYGSRGIIVSTFFQSWSQGVQVWGRVGMTKLWTAANVRVVGSGLAEADFLEEVSKLVGEHDVIHRSSSTGSRGGRQVQASLHRESTLTVDELAKMPPGRAVMLSSGIPATIVRLTHYSEKPYADLITASRAHYSVATLPDRTGDSAGITRTQPLAPVQEHP